MVCMFFYYSYAKQKSALLEAGCNHDTGSRRSLGVDFSVKLWWLMYLVTRCILTCKIFKKFYKYKNLDQLLGICNLRGITHFMIKKSVHFKTDTQCLLTNLLVKSRWCTLCVEILFFFVLFWGIGVWTFWVFDDHKRLSNLTLDSHNSPHSLPQPLLQWKPNLLSSAPPRQSQ